MGDLAVSSIATFHMKAQDRVRLLLSYGGAHRPIFWFSMGKDGSIYVGIRKSKFTEARSIVKSTDDNSIRVNYRDGEQLTATDGTFRSKVSVHASGIVHQPTPNSRFVRSPLRSLKAPDLICVVGYEHPKNFDPAKSIRNRDVVLNYPLDEMRPLWMRIYVAPYGMIFVGPAQSEVKHREILVFECAGLNSEAPRNSVQIDLCHGTAGPWPPYNFMAFPTFSASEA